MRIRRKTNHCLNCGRTLGEVYNYCPNCGQENTHLKVSFGTLLMDTIATYFAVDGKIGQTVKPFFAKPGYLTNKFLEGMRATYLHPIRMYVVVSLFYFFVLTLYGTDLMRSADIGSGPTDMVAFDYQDSLTSEDDYVITFGNKYNISKRLLEGTITLAKNDTLTATQIADSLQVKEDDSFRRFFIERTVRIQRSDREALTGYIIKNLSIMMFLLMPIFALILKILYIRSKRLYIEHLVHALHLHAFAYFIYGFSLLLYHYYISTGWILSGSFLLVSIYAYISFRKVYMQKWFKTMVKFFLVGWIYVFTILFFFIGELLISAMLY